MGVYIPNMDQPKSCWECDYASITCYEWFCDRLDKQFPIELQRGEINVLPDCPIIEIDDEIWEALKPKVETMSLAERGWITDDSNT